jgi:hypothetical protein
MESRVINPWTWQDRFGYVQARRPRVGWRRVGPASPARSSASRAWALPPLLVEIEATAAA